MIKNSGLGGAAAVPASAALLAAAGRFAPLGVSAADPVRFGVSGPLSGPMAEYGRIWQKGFDLALEEINGAGGLQGRLVELAFEDSQSDPKQSGPIAQKFVNDSSILAELGDLASPGSMAASPIYERGKLVQFGFTNSHPDFTKGGEYMFSPSISQTQDAKYLAGLAVERAGKKQAILYRNTDWGKVSSDIYVQELTALAASAAKRPNKRLKSIANSAASDNGCFRAKTTWRSPSRTRTAAAPRSPAPSRWNPVCSSSTNRPPG